MGRLVYETNVLRLALRHFTLASLRLRQSPPSEVFLELLLFRKCARVVVIEETLGSGFQVRQGILYFASTQRYPSVLALVRQLERNILCCKARSMTIPII